MDIVQLRQQQAEVMNQLNKELAKYFLLQTQYAAWYLADRKGVRVIHLAEAFGVTPTTVYEWIDKVKKDYAELIKEDNKNMVEENPDAD
jgi:hypothetical protein